MDYSKIDLQPLNHYNDIPNYTIREANQKYKLAKQGDIIALGVDQKLYFKAIEICNQLKYNLDDILNYLTSQIPLTTTQIEFIPQKRTIDAYYFKNNPRIENLTSTLPKYGRRVPSHIISPLLQLETSLKLVKFEDLMNAIFAQLILNKQIKLKIDQSPKTLAKLNYANRFETLSDATTLHVQTIDTPDEFNSMFKEN